MTNIYIQEILLIRYGISHFQERHLYESKYIGLEVLPGIFLDVDDNRDYILYDPYDPVDDNLSYEYANYYINVGFIDERGVIYFKSLI